MAKEPSPFFEDKPKPKKTKHKAFEDYKPIQKETKKVVENTTPKKVVKTTKNLQEKA